MTRLLLLFSFTLLASTAQAANFVYISQAGAGAQDGLSCATAKPVSYFNNAANWSATPSGIQIGPDTIVHACGTFTYNNTTFPFLIFQGSGTSGHPITLRAEAGVVLTSSVWGQKTNAAIITHGNSWLVIDGGGTPTTSAGAPSDGAVIQNTANGQGLANRLPSTAIWVDGSNVTVQNWNISNICLRSQGGNVGCNAGGSDDQAIGLLAVSNTTVTHNTVHDAMACIQREAGNADAGNVVSLNKLYHCNWGYRVSASANGNTSTGDVVDGNDISDAFNWDDTNPTPPPAFAGGDHHNGIFFNTNVSGSSIVNPTVKNNFVHGDMGQNETGDIFLDQNSGSITGVQVFNNVLAHTQNAPTNGMITGTGNCGGNPNYVVNNTFVGANNWQNVGVQGQEGAIASALVPTCTTSKNNILSQTTIGYWLNDGATLTTSDFNVLYNITGSTGGSLAYRTNTGARLANTASWISTTGFDTHSVTGNPNLTGTYIPGAGSSAINAGTNLTSLGITALNSDKNGVARGSSWDIGAIQFGAAPPPPPTPGPPPILLSVILQ